MWLEADSAAVVRSRVGVRAYVKGCASRAARSEGGQCSLPASSALQHGPQSISMWGGRCRIVGGARCQPSVRYRRVVRANNVAKAAYHVPWVAQPSFLEGGCGNSEGGSIDGEVYQHGLQGSTRVARQQQPDKVSDTLLQVGVRI